MPNLIENPFSKSEGDFNQRISEDDFGKRALNLLYCKSIAMIELTIKVEETLVKSLGQEAMERQLEDFLQRLMVKAAIDDILSGFKEYDVTNDPQWQVAHSLAWEQEKEKYLPKIR